MANYISGFKLYDVDGNLIKTSTDDITMNVVDASKITLTTALAPMQTLYYTGTEVVFTFTAKNDDTFSFTNAHLKATFDTALFEDLYYGVNAAPVTTNILAAGALDATIPTISSTGGTGYVTVHAKIK